ncbi:MAG: hypothetical protein LBQ00_00295 [Syntrophobacterales bacterium]|jgi:hypothetical protein|nr:hypothetical protein [Syntrophobacterales bacterium]
MRVLQCKQVVQSFFAEIGGYEGHTESRALRYNNRTYHIRPDDAYIFPDRIVCVEYEALKKPVESIGKYWWLFRRTDWLDEALEMHCFLFILNKKTGQVQGESSVILGEELSRVYPDAFHFRCLLPGEVSAERIRYLLDGTF